MRFFLIEDYELERKFLEYVQRCENIEVSNWRSTVIHAPIWVFKPFDFLDDTGEWLLERIGTSRQHELYELSEDEIISLQVVPPEALIEYIQHIGTLNTKYEYHC